MTTTINHSLLRLVTCGSVDDGKSTLIGRLLFDAKGIFEDQLDSITTASARYGTTGGGLDLALLTDGLKAEREQGITIDVAYRYFATPARKFIIADTPGHEQYTRNMATGASTADLAILLIDARHGVVTQTRRHAFIVSLLGIRHVVLAINKMDLVGWKQNVFEKIRADFAPVAAELNITHLTPIPMSALNGDNVTAASAHTPWYAGPTLLHHLESVDASPASEEACGFRLPVQIVSRPNLNFRGYMGTVAGGSVSPGDSVVVLPAGTRATVDKVFDADGPVQQLTDGRAGTITLLGEFDASRGDTIASLASAPSVASRILAHLVWFSLDPLVQKKSYRIKHTTRVHGAAVTDIRHKIDVNTLAKSPAGSLSVNDIAVVEIDCTGPLVFDSYSQNRSTGGFILIDRETNNTVAAGMIIAAIETAAGRGPVTPLERSIRLNQQPTLIELQGGTDATRRDVADALERILFDAGHLAAISSDRSAQAALLAAGLIAITTHPTPPTDAAVRFEVSGESANQQARAIRQQLAADHRLEGTAAKDSYVI